MSTLDAATAIIAPAVATANLSSHTLLLASAFFSEPVRVAAELTTVIVWLARGQAVYLERYWNQHRSNLTGET